jgi:hypothetical protein
MLGIPLETHEAGRKGFPSPRLSITWLYIQCVEFALEYRKLSVGTAYMETRYSEKSVESR